jgi:uncharacterized membrane protein YcaP (DUF421 family)
MPSLKPEEQFARDPNLQPPQSRSRPGRIVTILGALLEAQAHSSCFRFAMINDLAGFEAQISVGIMTFWCNLGSDRRDACSILRRRIMTSTWQDMFVLGLPLIEKILRPTIVYFFLILGIRIAGKRELAQLNPFDLVVLLTLSNTVQNAIIGNDNSVTGGIIGAATLFLVNYVVVRFLFAHEKLDKIVEGDADVLIEAGVIKEDRLKKELLTRAELETAAHRQGFSSLQDVERASLEPGGTIFFTGRKPSEDEARHRALAERLDLLSRQMAEIRDHLQRQKA